MHTVLTNAYVIMSNAYIIVVVILLFGLSIFVHELGHYLAARWCGMVIDTFSLGFGPAIWKRKVGETLYKIGCIPVGGYVALPQLDPASMQVVQGATPSDKQPESGAASGGKTETSRQLPYVAPWKKIVVSLAGASGNLLLAVVLAWIVYLAGKPMIATSTGGAVIGDVDPQSLAYASGLQPGDLILTVNGASVNTWQAFMQASALTDKATLRVQASGEGDVREITIPTTNDPTFNIAIVPGIEEGSVCKVGVVQSGSSAAGAGIKSGDYIRFFNSVRVASRAHLISMVQKCADREVPIVVERNGRTLDLKVTPALDRELKMVRIGIVFDAMVMTPMQQIGHDATGIVRMLKALLTPKQAGKAAQGLGGPVSILAMFWLYTQAGIMLALGFTRFLNVNLAILNLLPLPVLDGGHIVFSLWESVTRKPPSEKVVGWLVNFFAALLIAAMVLLTYRDIFRWWAIRRDVTAARSAAATNAPAADTNATPAVVATNTAPAVNR